MNMRFKRTEFVRLLDQHFLTYADVAERVGVTKNTVYYWAAGRAQPSKKNIRKIAEAFEVEPETLMTECLY